MWFDGVRQPNTLYIASVSRGKDSTAMLRAIQLMGWPLDGIVSVDVWFDDDTPAELPPMVAFKDEWDKKCLEVFGIPVTRVCATKRERRRNRKLPILLLPKANNRKVHRNDMGVSAKQRLLVQENQVRTS